jgi:hypothetical protein
MGQNKGMICIDGILLAGWRKIGRFAFMENYVMCDINPQKREIVFYITIGFDQEGLQYFKDFWGRNVKILEIDKEAAQSLRLLTNKKSLYENKFQ